MIVNSFKITPFVVLLLAIVLAACATEPYGSVEQHVINHGQYWQRAETSSALYLRGPKAQQTLNKDIARCVVEIRELERLAALQKGIPGMPRNPAYPDDGMNPGARMVDADAPGREGFLRTEVLPYHDFETCMFANGWERVETLPYDIADRSRSDYIDQVRANLFGTRHGTHEDYDYPDKNKFDVNNDG